MSWVARYPAEGLVPYDRSWVSRYVELAAPLHRAIGPSWRVEHVGSTSVPGLSAKPVIDVALGQPPGHDISNSIHTFRRLGWTDPIEIGDHHALFILDGEVRTAIAHVFSDERWATAHVRFFAEWLRSHDSDREEYERLKRRLVAAGAWGSTYTEGKADFVVRVVNMARAQRDLPPVQSL